MSETEIRISVFLPLAAAFLVSLSANLLHRISLWAGI